MKKPRLFFKNGREFFFLKRKLNGIAVLTEGFPTKPLSKPFNAGDRAHEVQCDLGFARTEAKRRP